MFILSLFETKMDGISPSEQEIVGETKQELFPSLLSHDNPS